MRRGCRITIALFIVLMVTGLFVFNRLYTWLTPAKMVPAEYFVLEGWAHELSLDEAVRVFTSHDYKGFLITAFPDTNLVTMGWEGRLTVQLHQPVMPAGSRTLRITLSGTPAAGEFPRFTVFVNDTATGEGRATATAKTFAYRLPDSVTVGSIAIAFLNDAVYRDEDRNLTVHNLYIDRLPCDLNHASVKYSRKGESGENIISPVFGSYALKAKHDIRACGIADSLVIPIPADTLVRSRTYSTALAVKEYLCPPGTPCPAILVMSHGVHARRSYISYRKAFGKGNTIGIITAEDTGLRKDNWFRSAAGRKKISRELAGILYAYFLL